MKEREIEDVVETLRTSKGCSLLIGSGCSVEAGIPIADNFVPDIKEKFPRAYKRACRGGGEATYLNCMKELSEYQRRELIRFYVDNAKLNWAHIAIAQLIANGFVDRVLTVNFDPLVIKACALLGQFPAVYDFASSQEFKEDAIPEKAVFYLHGQSTGFVLMITPAAVKEHSKKLEPVFRDAGRGRPWIVVGYSGENDPVCAHLSNVPNFDHDLYWICYEDRNPCEDVRKNLLEQNKSAYVVKGYDADGFFVTLAAKLGVFPPDLITQPFTHLEAQLDQLTLYKIPHHEHEVDIKKHGLLLVKEAIDTIGKEIPPELQAEARLMAGDYEEVLDIGKDEEKPEPDLDESRAWAALLQGNDLYEIGTTKDGEEAEKMFEQAIEKYKAAVDIKPDLHDALNNWGVALTHQAKTKDEAEAGRLLDQAIEKYKTVISIKHDSHKALNNWGNALLEQAKTKDAEEAGKLFELAIEKYKNAANINPDFYEALNNWGNALLKQAKTKDAEEAGKLFELAIEKYKNAANIKPDSYEALYNWGSALSHRAIKKDGEEADTLFAQAYEKYNTAVNIKSDFPATLYNWGNALSYQAKKKDGEEADKLFEQTCEKYKTAVNIKPDYHEALFNWGSALLHQAIMKDGEEADRLFAQAFEKFKTATDIKPDFHEALNNWGNALLGRAKTKDGEEAGRLFDQAYEKYKAAVDIKPDFHEALNNWGGALLEQVKMKDGGEADKLLEEAKEKCIKAESISEGSGAYNLACIHVLRGSELECRKWLEKGRDIGELPSKEHIEKDLDFDSVRDSDWFKEFLQSI